MPHPSIQVNATQRSRSIDDFDSWLETAALASLIGFWPAVQRWINPCWQVKPNLSTLRDLISQISFNECTMVCLLHRCQPSFCCTPAPGPACAPGICSPLESDEAEGCDAVWGGGGVRDFSLRGRPRAAHREAPGQTGTGAESTGKLTEDLCVRVYYFPFP